LVVSAALALGVAARVARTPGPGTRPFLWLSAAIGFWCLAGAGHALASTLPEKLIWAKLQYLGIASAAPFGLLFTAEYAGMRWFSRQDRARLPLAAKLLWAIPITTVALAATNEWHHAVWSAVALAPNGRAVYSYGPWFWVSAIYSYALLLTGTLLAGRVARRSPGPLRHQFTAVLAAALVPWAGNGLFLAGLTPAGVDITPLAFAASSLLFAWALYRSYLFDLIPVARDLVIDSLSDATVVIDGSRRILDMNAAARDLATLKATVPPHDASWVGRDLAAVFPMLTDLPLEMSSAALTSPLLTAAGDPVWFDVRVLPVRWRGREPYAWVILLRDITAQRRAAAEHEALQQRVHEQHRREGLSILAGGMAHEFNNMLAGIIGHADLLSMQIPASSRTGDSVSAILLGAQRAADLVSKMLAYAGERHGSIARVDVEALTLDLLDVLRASTARHCSITYEGAPAIIDGDPTQIRQVAMNLIVNAVEAVGDAGRITVRTGIQTLAAADLSQMRFGQSAEPGDFAFLDVRDEGVGMDALTLRRLFQPFFTTKPTGQGLGLAAVQGIVLGHRGALRVDSEPGQGSCFRVWFPMASAFERTDQRVGAMPFNGFQRANHDAVAMAGTETG
jgi:signal transduction histidine kinase